VGIGGVETSTLADYDGRDGSLVLVREWVISALMPVCKFGLLLREDVSTMLGEVTEVEVAILICRRFLESWIKFRPDD
jgi:hypothetical protein